MPIEASQPLLIIGASVRAAAQSAVRAGYQVWGADLFADADLCSIATAKSVSRYPAELLSALADAPRGPWMYTGALENYPSLIERMARVKTCWGNSAPVLRRVRDPLLLASILPSQGVAFPTTYKVETSTNLPENHSSHWLLKPKRSGGGSKVTWRDEQKPSLLTGRYYLQQFVPGEACSAVYVAASGRAELLGVTKQLLGTPWLETKGFSYCGSVGPIELSLKDRVELQHIGNVLAKQFALVGLFGVDLVRRLSDEAPAGQGEFVMIEINPRYTASMEVLERTMNFATIPWHANACEQGVLPTAAELSPARSDRYLAKGILFAREDTTFDPQVAEYVRAMNVDPLLPSIADVPHVDTPIDRGSPVVTLFAAGKNLIDAEAQLCSKVSEFEAVLYST